MFYFRCGIEFRREREAAQTTTSRIVIRAALSEKSEGGRNLSVSKISFEKLRSLRVSGEREREREMNSNESKG